VSTTTSSTTPTEAPPKRSYVPRGLGLDRFSGIYLWIVFIVVFGIWTPSEFLTMSTVHSIASTNAVTGIVALAVLIPLAGGLYDLSVGATANLTGMIAITQLNHGWSVVPAIALSLLVGIAVGLVNSVVVVALRVNSFIATLGMSSILSAVLVIITGDNSPLPPSSTAWNNLTQTTVGGFQVIVLYLVVIAFVLWWLMAHTPAGRYLYAIGGNAEAARLSGVRVQRFSTFALVLSAGIAGLGGVLFTSQSGPSLSFGPALLLPAFAAAFLGSTQLVPGKFNVWGTLLAIFVLATGVYGLELVSGAAWLSDMFNGVALIIAVALSINRGSVSRRKLRSATKPSDTAPGADGDPEPRNSGQAGRVNAEKATGPM
jgi:ribose transport system permease protein